MKKRLKITLVSVFVSALIFAYSVIIPKNAESAFLINAKEKRLTPIYAVERSDNLVAVSFDAAWGADKTLEILSVLDKYNVKATFFLVAFWAEKYPDLVKTIVDAGHEIGTHSSSHPHFNKLNYDKSKEELTDSIARIERITNTKIKLFRPPFGEYDNKLLNLCKELDITAIQWDVDTLDWKGISPSEISNRVVTKTKSGSIILCHNNADHIVDALKTFLPLLIEKGYTVTYVGNVIYRDNFTIGSDGVQRPLEIR